MQPGMDDDRGDGAPPAQAKQDWISWLLSRIAYRAALHPRRTLAVACILTAVAAWLAVTRLEFRTSRLDLLSDSSGYNQRWLTYLDRFGHDDDAVIVVSHTEPAQVAAVLTAVGQRLEADSRLSGVLYRKSVGAVAEKALHLMPARELEQLDQLLQACVGMLRSSQSSSMNSAVQFASAQHAAGQSASSFGDAAAFGEADDGLVASAEAALGQAAAAMNQQLSSAIAQAQNGLDQLQRTVPQEGPLLLEDEGRLGICLIRLPHVDAKPREAKALLDCLHGHLRTLRSEHAGVDIWLTGMPVLEWDESQSSQRDMQNATLLSLVGVALIIVFGFGSWRMPCVAVLCLAMGLVWTVGLAAIFIGHLNLFSVAFGAIIAGLGIDYAIHLLSRLNENPANISTEELPLALADAVGHCGKGILTGSVTTAAAFGVAMLTPFRGMTELGTICALGTLSCMVATIWILPALLMWQAKVRLPAIWNRSARAESSAIVGGAVGLVGENSGLLVRFRRYTNRLVEATNGVVLRQRSWVVIGMCAVTALAMMQAGRLRYDHNLLNLQADGLPSVHAELELTRRSGQSAWFAISLAHSPQQARALHEQLSKLPSVARVEEIGSVIASAATHPYKSELVTECRIHAEQLAQQLAVSRAQAMPVAAPHASSLVHMASHTATSHVEPTGAAPPVVMPMQQLAESVQRMAASDSPTLEDFPKPVRDRMASHDGETFLLRIFARENLWQRENLGEFVKELESVDPRVTGHPIQTWYASGELENSYYQAGIYALLAVAALLMMDFGSIRLVILAMVPVCLSLMQLCGLLVWLDIPFNAANMIVLPLIIGIGIDDGVHIMHEYSMRGAKTFTLSTNTTLAILLTSLTTMVGFGSMGVADHRGLQSLGIVLLVGVGLCLLNSCFTLPAVLSYLGPQDTDLEPEAAPVESRSNAARRTNTSPKAPAAQPVVATETGTLAGCSVLLRDVPIVMSLPAYPDVHC